MRKALNQLVLEPFLSITAMWLLKQNECIELVQVENWFFDQNGKKNKGRGRRGLCGQDSLNNRGGGFSLIGELEK